MTEHQLKLKRNKAKIGNIETEGWELTMIYRHVSHELLFTPWPTENLICLVCRTCTLPLIDFIEDKEDA